MILIDKLLGEASSSFHFILSSLGIVVPHILRSVFQGTMLKLIHKICNAC